MKSILQLCAFSMALSGTAYASVPEQKEIIFEILRDGEPFGMHSVTFETIQNALNVLVEIEMRVGLGPITLFRYQHTNEETWDGAQIQYLESRTNDNGKNYEVSATWGQTLNVNANGRQYEAPKTLFTTSYWNPVTIQSDQLLNTQKGEIETITVDYLGTEKFRNRG